MIEKIGRMVINQVDSFLYALGYIGQVFSSSLFFFKRGKAARKILIMQLLFTCVEALPLICVLSAAIGSAIYILGYQFLAQNGLANLVYTVEILIVTQELGPLLVAFVVTARSATAIATELGEMVTSHQIESYISFGINPINHLVVPRFLGVTLSLFLLNLYFSLCGLFSPILISQFVSTVEVDEYISDLFKAISMKPLLISIFKSIIFGMIISITATFYGFNVERASTEIPVAGISAVGKSFFGIIIADVAIVVLSIL